MLLSYKTLRLEAQHESTRIKLCSRHLELAQIITKEVLEKTGMFYEEGQMSREDVRTRVAAQCLDLKPFTKLGDYLSDLDGWHDMLE